MPQVAVGHCLQRFDNQVVEALNFQTEVTNFRFLTPSGTYHHVGVYRIELFAGLALLKIHLAWEDFIESVFVRYMRGASSPTGFSPTLLTRQETSISNAMNKLLGSGRDFLNWSPNNITSRANTYFYQGEPFQFAISSVRHTLDDINVVRNRFAHRSDYASQEFQGVVRNAFGYIPRGINTGRFLLRINPNPIAHGQTFLDFYANTLIGAARSIVP